MPSQTFLLLVPALSLAAVAAMALALVRARRSHAREMARCREETARALAFHRQTLGAVTGGRLRLCEPADVPALLRGERLWSLPLLDGGDVSLFRQNLRLIAARRGFSDGRLDALCSCVSEAAGNAVRHSQGGIAQVWAADEGVTVLVSDCGAGLAPDALLGAGEGRPDAGLGMGFRLMLALADSVVLCTGADGTQLVLTVRNRGAEEEREEARKEEAREEETREEREGAGGKAGVKEETLEWAA